MLADPETRLPHEIRTERTCLRRWRAVDREPFARINADPRVAEFLHDPLTREQSDAMIDRIEAHFTERGFSLWAVELPGISLLAGCLGLQVPRFEAHFTPCVEIAWRLAPEHWGRGFATEAARAVLAFGFEVLGLPEIVSFGVRENQRSRRVMERLGMTTDPREDFDHPALDVGHPLSRHVLYRLASPSSSVEMPDGAG
jgi:RimJ/RimL family protein N-acetyltransferase